MITTLVISSTAFQNFSTSYFLLRFGPLHRVIRLQRVKASKSRQDLGDVLGEFTMPLVVPRSLCPLRIFSFSCPNRPRSPTRLDAVLALLFLTPLYLSGSHQLCRETSRQHQQPDQRFCVCHGETYGNVSLKEHTIDQLEILLNIKGRPKRHKDSNTLQYSIAGSYAEKADQNAVAHRFAYPP